MKIESIKPIPLKSIIGPNTKKAKRELVVKLEAKDRAKKASTVEQIETMTASRSIDKIAVSGFCPIPRIISLGTKT